MGDSQKMMIRVDLNLSNKQKALFNNSFKKIIEHAFNLSFFGRRGKMSRGRGGKDWLYMDCFFDHF